MSDATFGLLQQAFAFSIWSNLVSPDTHLSPSALASQLQNSVNNAITNYASSIGTGWKIVWGPSVFSAGSSDNPFLTPNNLPPSLSNGVGSGIADNAMYVVSNGAGVYVVAIAATNPQSTFDWMQEDFQVGTVVPFPINSEKIIDGVAISAGTALGVNILMTLESPSGFPAAGTTLMAFLNGLTGTTDTLIFAGHSLGGALAPTLAFSLFPQGTPAKGPWTNVYVLPTAGPTPGTVEFGTAFNNAFPPATDSTAPEGTPNQFNTDLWNQYDLVPHAWTNIVGSSFPEYAIPQSTLKALDPRVTLPCIFGTLAYPATITIPYLGELAVDEANKSGATFGPIQNQVLIPSTVPNGTISSINEFIEALGQQHVAAYYALFGISDIYDPTVVNGWVSFLQAIWVKYFAPLLPPAIPKL